MEKERVEYIDLYRGLAILLMVMGHVGFGETFSHYIHAFHMPMWFFISGYFFVDKGYSYQTYLKIRGKKLLIPYVFFALLHYAVAVLFVDRSQGIFHAEFLKAFFLSNHTNVPISGVFWFITCLLIVEILFLYLKRRIRSERNLLLAVLTLSLLGMLYCRVSPVRMIWTADTALVSLLLYYAGYAARNDPKLNGWYNQILAMKPWKTGIAFIINFVLIVLTPYINMRTATYSNPVLFYGNALVAILIYLNICFYLSNHQNAFLNRVKKWLAYVGKESVIYLYLNQIVILFFYILVMLIPLSGLVKSILILFVSMWMLTRLSRYFLRTRLRIFAGKSL